MITKFPLQFPVWVFFAVLLWVLRLFTSSVNWQKYLSWPFLFEVYRISAQRFSPKLLLLLLLLLDFLFDFILRFIHSLCRWFAFDVLLSSRIWLGSVFLFILVQFRKLFFFLFCILDFDFRISSFLTWPGDTIAKKVILANAEWAEYLKKCAMDI